MELLQKIKEKWQKYLKEMAEANEKMWQGHGPSCCGKEKKEGVKDDQR